MARGVLSPDTALHGAIHGHCSRAISDMLTSRLLTGAMALLTVSAAFGYARAAGTDGPLHVPPISPTASADRGPFAAPRPDDDLTLIRESLPRSLPALQVSRVISVLGGSVSLAGHSLSIPAGAVTLPTVFTLTLMPTGHVDVELTGVLTSLLGRDVDVGAAGLRRPASLTLTWARASNVDDPHRLRIARVANDVTELLATDVDSGSRTVSTALEHLSRYVLVIE